MWMVRAARGGRLADEFLDKRCVAIGWGQYGDLNQYRDKAALLKVARDQAADGHVSDGQINAAVSQQLRFRDELRVGDRIATYDSSRRVYHVGTITGDYRYDPDRLPPCENVRDVQWQGEVMRDRLSVAARNTLGSTLTLFRVPDWAQEEIEALLAGQVPAAADDHEASEDETELLKRYREEAFEIVKDRVNRLAPDEMERLVAGLLRAMGYRTRESKRGPDRGADILASPDGFGFESPRIVVEVKHRPNTQIGAQDLRSFLGGRHGSDKGLYVSTGGFTKDALYEADRAKIPLALMDLGSLISALMDHYENADAETRSLLPLTRLFWPI
ncbi:MAG: restriction endonuclease [Spiribacter salinus]|uniref:Restriction endonuclease n=1 Tax=Spiribacter salinus TaxID=1335746 RepID=A0A540VRT6_9GAMM|nr:MAG: restriction endonuclease [Spiribacter salinus]